jgi:hypothetical protein
MAVIMVGPCSLLHANGKEGATEGDEDGKLCCGVEVDVAVAVDVVVLALLVLLLVEEGRTEGVLLLLLVLELLLLLLPVMEVKVGISTDGTDEGYKCRCVR